MTIAIENKVEVDRLVRECEISIFKLLNTPVSLKIYAPINDTIEYSHSTAKPLFKNWIKEKFIDGTPKTRSELYKLYKQDNGENVIPEKTFSSKLSALMIEHRQVVNKHVFINNPLESRYYYGLFEWFEGDILQDEYVKKIKPSKEG